jgi:sulfur relay (sulfurtransferase) DsrF/TusC family protein
MDALMIVIKSGPAAVARVEEGLRLTAAMLGYDMLPVIVFVDEGVECLKSGAFEDPTMDDYIEAASDLAGIYALSESLEARGVREGDLAENVEVTSIDLGGLAEMMAECDKVAAY